MFKICDYNKEFLKYSWKWLNDKEIKELTMTSDFTKKQQKEFFLSLKNRVDYKIFGIKIDNTPVGACGLKNITKEDAEYWGYIGEKKYWGKGYGVQIINEMINFAKKVGISNFYLKVSKTNIRATNLYLKYGFIINNELSATDILHMNLNITFKKC